MTTQARDGRMGLKIRGRKFIKLTSQAITSVLVVGHVVANLWYLTLKTRLYWQNFERAIALPWVLIILLCEYAYFVSAAMVATHNVLMPRTRPVIPLDLAGRRSYPTVDIFVSCFKEPIDVLQDTIRAALAVDYPKDCTRLLVLDDGGDDELEAFCAALQEETAGRVVYLHREKIPGAPKDFKCGNMNYGLQHSTAEYLLFMDADMIAHPSIVKRLLPFLVHFPKVAFVQTPQSFYNLPTGDPLIDANTVFQQMIMPQRDQLGTSSFLGTGAMFRRESLVEIGGFQKGSVTEDTLTAYVLFNNGYKSVYVNDSLQAGLAPWTFEGFIEQRQRWAIGSMQQFGISWRFMLGWNSKLRFVEKVWYFLHTTNHFVSVFNVVLMLTLLGALAFRFNLVVTDSDEDNRKLMGYLGLHLILLRFSWMLLWVNIPRCVQGRNRSDSYFWWVSPFYVKISLQALFLGGQSFSSKFLPTNSVDQASGGHRPLRKVAFHIAYSIVGFLVVVYKTAKLITVSGVRNCDDDFYVLGLSIFVLFTSANLLVPVFFILRPTGPKAEERQSLLRYNSDGVPYFPTDDELLPRWDWSVIWYEVFNIAQLAFWAAVFVIYLSGTHEELQHWWCMTQQSFVGHIRDLRWYPSSFHFGSFVS